MQQMRNCFCRFAGMLDDILAGSFAVWQSKTILARSFYGSFEVAFVIACLDHIARVIVNANHTM
jgi:hypothetical protein